MNFLTLYDPTWCQRLDGIILYFFKQVNNTLFLEPCIDNKLIYIFSTCWKCSTDSYDSSHDKGAFKNRR